MKFEIESLSDALWMIREQIKINEQVKTRREPNLARPFITSKPIRRFSTSFAKLHPEKSAENPKLFEDIDVKPVEKSHFVLDMVLEIEDENEKSDS